MPRSGSAWPNAVSAFEYAELEHQEQFAKQGGQLPKSGAVRWSLQLQCELVGDGPGGRACFASKPEGCCGGVQHLGDLHASGLAAPVISDNGRRLLSWLGTPMAPRPRETRNFPMAPPSSRRRPAELTAPPRRRRSHGPAPIP